MYIREFLKIFNKDKAIDFFNKTFNDLINNWKLKNKIAIYDWKESIFEILKWYLKKFKNKTVVDNKIKYFWPFIKNVSNILSNMSMRLNRIDICLYANKCIAKLNNNEEQIKDYKLIWINSINSDLIRLGGQDLSLFVLKLFDSEYKKMSLTTRFSYGTYLNDYKTKREEIYKLQPEVIEAIDWLNLFIKKMKEIVKEYKLNTLNFVKHNILDINPKPIEWQEFFNIWYVNEKFIRPMLKLLFRYKEENGKEYILERYIERNDNLLSIYELIYNCSDNIEFKHKFSVSD